MNQVEKDDLKQKDESHPKRVWTSLLTNTKYLSGLLTLEYSFRKAGSKYPLVVLHTDKFPAEGHAALKARGIGTRKLPNLAPARSKDYANDPRFNEVWPKLAVFGLTGYDRIVLLDCDMLVLKNMDELMEMELDPPEIGGEGQKVYAASHACTCNPLHKPHYPKDWIPENCAFTSQHGQPDDAQKNGAPATVGVGGMNGGIVVCNPSQGTFDKVLDVLKDGELTSTFGFPDQDLLTHCFGKRWVGLSYVYNALKTLRWKGVHDAIWRDNEVKNIHYIFSPKPWDETPETASEDTHLWWLKVNQERLAEEKANGIDDGW